MILQANIRTEDGVKAWVTDETWVTTSGAITYDSLYNGEHYDARLETTGWMEPGYDTTNWKVNTHSSLTRTDWDVSRRLKYLTQPTSPRNTFLRSDEYCW